MRPRGSAVRFESFLREVRDDVGFWATAVALVVGSNHVGENQKGWGMEIDLACSFVRRQECYDLFSDGMLSSSGAGMGVNILTDREHCEVSKTLGVGPCVKPCLSGQYLRPVGVRLCSRLAELGLAGTRLGHTESSSTGYAVQ
ncbi:hypothetical protein L1887_14892 [Cichorium endivia]|nr:hypothetical protein L1887_14892 [Cichorium endivia]